MIIVSFTDEEIAEAQRIRAEEDNNPGEQVFDSDNRWTGKLGQWAVERKFSSLALVGRDHNYSTFDFSNGTFLYEVKTKNGKFPYSEAFQFDVNDRQHRKNPCDYYIACYWQLGGYDLVIAKWIPKSDVGRLGRFMEKGDLFLGKYPVEADRWDIDFKRMREIEKLLV